MRMVVRALGVATFIAAFRSEVVLAQGTSRYAADASVGMWGQQTTGVYSDDGGGGFSGELSVARRFHSNASGGMIVGANAAYYLQIGGGDSCRLLPGGDCAPQSPSVRLVGALTGWESRNGWFRAMAGLAYADPTTGGGTVAIQARLDAAVWIVRHLGLTAAVHPAVIPRYRGDTFRLIGVGVGVRVR